MFSGNLGRSELKSLNLASAKLAEVVAPGLLGRESQPSLGSRSPGFRELLEEVYRVNANASPTSVPLLTLIHVIY